MRPKQIALLAGAVLVLLAGATCGGAWLWLQSHRDELRDRGRSALREGARFGTGRTAQACIAEALVRLPPGASPWGNVLEEAGNKVFLEGCLKTATLDPAACEGVPPRKEVVRSATWLAARCQTHGRGQEASCARLLGAVQERCLALRSPVAPGTRDVAPASDGPPSGGPPSDGPPSDGPPSDGPPSDGPPAPARPARVPSGAPRP